MTCLLIAGTALGGCAAGGGSHLDVQKEKTYELGEAVTILPKDFIEGDVSESDLENMKIESDLLTSPKYDYNGFKGEVKTAGEDYLELGDYTLTLVDGNSKYPIKLTVKDTKAPDFIMAPARRVVASGSTEEDVLRTYRAEDKDEVSLSLDGDFDLNEPGDYTARVVAVDPSGNQADTEISLKVTGDGEMITSDDTADLNPDDYTDQTQTDQTEQPETTDSGQSDDEAALPDDSEPTEKPDDSQTETPACGVSHAPEGATIYYSFDEAYAAGIAWNQLDPNNYFFYLQGADDCGNPVYLITTGTRSGDDGI